jgi:hypothetical protein
MYYSWKRHYIINTGLVRLVSSQPASSAFLSHQFSTNQQPPASQQYFSLTTNQHQPPATSQPNEFACFMNTMFEISDAFLDSAS